MESTTITSVAHEQAAPRRLAASIGRNTIFGILASVVQVATRLVTVPTIISHLGLGGFGIWSIIMTIATYMRFGSVGIKSAFQKYVAASTGSGEYDETSKLLSTGTAAMLGISLVGLVPVSIFSGKIAQLAGVPPEFLHSASWAISMLAITMVFANAGAAYEAAVMGGHRIDLIRKFSTFTCVGEAVAIVTLVKFGFGLFAMATVMAVSEMVFVLCCYVAAHRVVPQIRLRIDQISSGVIRELVRFAGSYQLVGILQLTYSAIAPIAILRSYGANQAGVFAVASRLVSPISMCMFAFVVPILSSGAMVYASGSSENMRSLLSKSFKVTLIITLIPLGIICAFGTNFVTAWTGQADPQFRATLWLISLGTLFQAIALLGLVLYRSSGKAVIDNAREVARIAILVVVVLLAQRLGFFGVLAGFAAAEFVGMVVMLYAVAKTFHAFDPAKMARDALRVAMATIVIVALGVVVAQISLPLGLGFRATAIVRALAIGLAVMLAAYPALTHTGALSSSEVRSIMGAFKRNAVSGD